MTPIPSSAQADLLGPIHPDFLERRFGEPDLQGLLWEADQTSAKPNPRSSPRIAPGQEDLRLTRSLKPIQFGKQRELYPARYVIPGESHRHRILEYEMPLYLNGRGELQRF